MAHDAAALRLRTCDTGDRAGGGGARQRAVRGEGREGDRGGEGEGVRVGGATAGRSGSMLGGDRRHSRSHTDRPL